MKVFLTLLSASAILSTFAFADIKNPNTQMKQKMMHQEENQMHKEMKNREMMTKEGENKLDRGPDKVSNEMGMQDKGNAYGEGQGMMQGQGKKMMQGGSGKGKGGR